MQCSDEELRAELLPLVEVAWMSEHMTDTILRGTARLMRQADDSSTPLRFVRRDGGRIGENRKALRDAQRERLRAHFARTLRPEVMAYMFER